MQEHKKNLLITAAAGLAYYGTKVLLKKLTGYRFQGKRALITGASRGLGLVLARQLVGQGAQVALAARNSQELDTARTDLLEEFPEASVITVVCDITERADVEAMIAEVEKKFGGIDILINNAGIISVGPMETMTIEDFERAMKTHFWGPLYATLAALPGMKAQGGGRVANIASIGGKVSVPHLLPYSASKFALVGLSEGLHAELAKDGVVVTTVCPGLMRTGSHTHAEVKGEHSTEYTWFSLLDTLPLTSVSAERAAGQILSAIRDGKAEIIISPQAKLLAMLHERMPDHFADVAALINEFMPSPGPGGSRMKKGSEIESSVVPSVLTTLGDKAAARNNELASA